MKRFWSRTLAFLLVLVMVTALAVNVSAEGQQGVSFTKEAVYKTHKIPEATPNTFEAWVKLPKELGGSDRGGVIMGAYGNGTPNISFEVHTNGNPRIYWAENTEKVHNWIFKDVNLFTGNWEHVAMVRDMEEGKALCYLNGKLAGTLDASESEDIVPVMPLCLGGDHRADNSQYFRGQIRGVAIYSDARTADEVAADMLTPGEDDLLLRYDMAGKDGAQTLADLTGNGYDAVLSQRWLAEKDPVTDYAYSFMVIGDTQIVAEQYPALFPYIYQYVLDNVEKKNVKFVIGLGDITENSVSAEWDLATKSIFKMDGVVPYSLVRGNHDKVADYVTAIPMEKYKDIVGGTFDGDMRNTWQTFQVGQVKYLVLCLDYGPSNAVLKWADEVVASHPDHNVIVTTHAYLYRNGTTLDANDFCPPTSNGGFNNGDQIWDKLIRKHENIVLVLCGHDPCGQIIMTQTQGDHGNTVTQMLIDGQHVDKSDEGVGLVATFYFSEDGRDVTVDYYATLKQKYFMTENQFSFTLDLVDVEQAAPEATEGAGTGESGDPQTPGNDTQPDGTLIMIIAGVAVVAVAAAVVVVVILRKKK